MTCEGEMSYQYQLVLVVCSIRYSAVFFKNGLEGLRQDLGILNELLYYLLLSVLLIVIICAFTYANMKEISNADLSLVLKHIPPL